MSTASARREPDYLYPIIQKGRQEFMLVEFDNVFRCQTEQMLLYMLYHKYDRFISEYPDLVSCKKCTPDQLFTLASSFKPPEMLHVLRGTREITDDMKQKDLSVAPGLIAEATEYGFSQLRTEIALNHLVMSDYVSKLYIVHDYWTESMLRQISRVFKNMVNKKVFALQGNPTDTFLTYDEQFTTFMINDIDALHIILQRADEKRLKDMYFLCNASLLCNLQSVEEKEVKYRHHEDFEDYKDKKICIVDFFRPLKA